MADDVDVMVMGVTMVVLLFNLTLIVKVMMVIYIPQPGVKKSRNAELKFKNLSLAKKMVVKMVRVVPSTKKDRNCPSGCVPAAEGKGARGGSSHTVRPPGTCGPPRTAWSGAPGSLKDWDHR